MFKPKPSLILPSVDSVALPEYFQNFFVDKVRQISDSLCSTSTDPTPAPDQICKNVNFSKFERMKIYEVEEIIKKSSAATCKLDPMPTSFVKKCVVELAPYITCVVNRSFEEGTFPKKSEGCHCFSPHERVKVGSRAVEELSTSC